MSSHTKGVLLDVGSGKQPYKKLFNNHVEHYLSMDYPKIKDQKDHAKPSIMGDGYNLPVRCNVIDTVLNTQVLGDVSSPDLFISELKRVLKKEGILLISVPLLFPVSSIVDMYRYTNHGIIFLLVKNGFKIERVDRNGGFGVFMMQMLLHYFNYRFFRNVPGVFLKSLFGILRIVLTPLLLAVNLICNILAIALDWFDIDESFTLNYTILAKIEEKSDR